MNLLTACVLATGCLTQQAIPVDAGDIARGRSFWSFCQPERCVVPQTSDPAWPRDSLDSFILAKLDERDLKPVGDASREVYLRRLSFDLTGLPPVREAVETFRSDDSPMAFESLVDRLLSSPGFGQRWGRHWLDVARYASSVGSTKNYVFRHAWRYRDYVLDALNVDKPYDAFVREQIAGDLLPADSVWRCSRNRTATGFLTLGCQSFNEMDPGRYRAEEVAEQVDTIGRAFLELTLDCARCHDHQFAPIPTRDFYALAGIPRSTQVLSGFRRSICPVPAWNLRRFAGWTGA